MVQSIRQFQREGGVMRHLEAIDHAVTDKLLGGDVSPQLPTTTATKQESPTHHRVDDDHHFEERRQEEEANGGTNESAQQQQESGSDTNGEAHGRHTHHGQWHQHPDHEPHSG